MTNNHSSSNGEAAMATHPGGPQLHLVGSSNTFHPRTTKTQQSLPRWAVYGLIAFYCAAAWSFAFWIVSALL